MGRLRRWGFSPGVAPGAPPSTARPRPLGDLARRAPKTRASVGRLRRWGISPTWPQGPLGDLVPTWPQTPRLCGADAPPPPLGDLARRGPMRPTPWAARRWGSPPTWPQAPALHGPPARWGVSPTWPQDPRLCGGLAPTSRVSWGREGSLEGQKNWRYFTRPSYEATHALRVSHPGLSNEQACGRGGTYMGKEAPAAAAHDHHAPPWRPLCLAVGTTVGIARWCCARHIGVVHSTSQVNVRSAPA